MNLNKYGLHERQDEGSAHKFYQIIIINFFNGVKTHFFDMLKYDNLFSMLSEGVVFQKKKKKSRMAKSQSQ